MKLISIIISAGLCFGFGSACRSGKSTSHLAAVNGFDPERYMGVWYEGARLPHRFEKGMEDVTAVYELQNDGTISVLNRGMVNGKVKEIRGVARRKKDSGTTGELEVSFFRPFYGAYRILWLEPDYSGAIVTSNTDDYLWFLFRSPVLTEKLLPAYRKRAEEWGFDCARLEYPVSSSSKHGKP